jgi:DUF1680 family protein
VHKGYIEITKEWIKGDKIELTLPMAVRRVIADKNVKDDINKVAFEYGPIVYCAEKIDNDAKFSDIFIPDNAELNVSKENILTDTVNIITGKVNVINSSKKKELFNLTLIPYYIWSNRGVGEMKVWFPNMVDIR